MKVVAAALLFQPQRAGRDYRGITSDYQDSIFLDDHDVRIYHAVAFLFYRLEFLWRNQKLDNSSKTIRFYVLAGIGIVITNNKSVFTMKKSKLATVSESFISMAKDEERLKATVEKIFLIVSERLTEMGVSGYEKVRDTIRSEAFASAFRERLAGLRLDVHGSQQQC